MKKPIQVLDRSEYLCEQLIVQLSNTRFVLYVNETVDFGDAGFADEDRLREIRRVLFGKAILRCV